MNLVIELTTSLAIGIVKAPMLAPTSATTFPSTMNSEKSATSDSDHSPMHLNVWDEA